MRASWRALKHNTTQHNRLSHLPTPSQQRTSKNTQLSNINHVPALSGSPPNRGHPGGTPGGEGSREDTQGGPWGDTPRGTQGVLPGLPGGNPRGSPQWTTLGTPGIPSVGPRGDPCGRRGHQGGNTGGPPWYPPGLPPMISRGIPQGNPAPSVTPRNPSVVHPEALLGHACW